MARSNAVGKMRQIAEDLDNDPKVVLRRAVGGLDKELDVLHSQVLIAHYVRPAKSKGGIWMPDRQIEEDRFQGNIGLVLAVGPGAFKDDAVAQFHGKTLQPDDWVMFNPGDGQAFFYKEVPCRLFQDTRILMKITTPEFYY